jgi:hypothetical protein
MSLRTLATASLVAVSALCVAQAATRSPPGDQPPQQQGERGDRGGRHRPPVSLDRFAMENAIAERLATQTGRTKDEIAALLAKQPPHEIARSLGIDEATMKSICDEARAAVVSKAQDAQLITASQANQLKNAPPPGRRPPADDGDDRPQPPGE